MINTSVHVERAGGGSQEGEQVDKQVYWWFQVKNRVGNPLLSKGMAKGSDTGVAQPQQIWCCRYLED